MITTIEISGSTIRCARVANGALVSLDHHPIAEGVDPIEALGKAPLPTPLGRVAVTLNHSDLLLRTMVQPPCPPERLERIVRFELQTARGEDTQPVSMSWHLVKSGGDGDMRVLALMTKHDLIDRIKAAVAQHEGKLASLVPSGIGLFHAWKRQIGGDSSEDCVIVDVGNTQVHVALIKAGELLLIRTQGPGMGELAKDIAEAQGIPLSEAKTLISRLGKGSPENLHNLIRRHVQNISTSITNTVRFAKAQLQLDQFEPKSTYIAGAGAQVFGFADHLQERTHNPVRMLNPFAGLIPNMPSTILDEAAALPSPWTVCLGTAGSTHFELDGLHEARQQRTNFWRTDGVLRVACGFAAACILIAAGRQQLALGTTSTALEQLQGTNDSGLVPKAEGVFKEMAEQEMARQAALQRIDFLAGERRPGRAVVEVLSAIIQQQDPETCPVMLREYRVLRQGNAVHIELEGIAESARNRSTADVLRTFERGLVRAYAPISSMVAIPKPATGTAQEFAYRIVIPDVSMGVTKGGTAQNIQLTVTADAATDPRGAAQVAIDRNRVGEAEATVMVTTGGAQQTFAWSERTGLAGRR